MSFIQNWEKEFRKWLGTERLRVFAAGIDSKPDVSIQSKDCNS